MEIERKYLLKYLPDNLDTYEHHLIEQGYLATQPTIRIRRFDDRYVLTVKENCAPSASSSSSLPLVNREEEFDLSPDTYRRLLLKCDGCLVCKTRYHIPLFSPIGNLVAELDVFHAPHRGLLLVEVEFPSIDDALAFRKPDWFGTDVSHDPHYRNSYLSAHPFSINN